MNIEKIIIETSMYQKYVVLLVLIFVIVLFLKY